MFTLKLPQSLILPLMLFLVLTGCQDNECDCQDLSDKWINDRLTNTTLQECDVVENFLLKSDGSIDIRRLYTDNQGIAKDTTLINVAKWMANECTFRLMTLDDLSYNYNQANFLCPFATQSRSPVAQLLYTDIYTFNATLDGCSKLFIDSDEWLID